MNDLNQQNFESEVLSVGILVLIAFWVPWCAPCKRIAPFIEEIADQFRGKMRALKANIDDNRELARIYGFYVFRHFAYLKMGSKNWKNSKRRYQYVNLIYM